MRRYDPAAWYWLADDGRLFSSAASALIQASDAGYVAWLADGTRATSWPRDTTGAQTSAALQWVFDQAGLAVAVDLATVKTVRTNALRAACAAAITGNGFASSALGAVHGYPSDVISQTNLLGSVTDSLLPGLPATWTTPFWCANTTGAWNFAAHTAAQIQQVGQDGKAAVVAAQQKLAGLNAQVAAATTVAAIQAVTWA